MQFEKTLVENKPTSPQLAMTMMVFMVHGLFSSLQFTYAQFPCAELTGELLYDPFWEAVKSGELWIQGMCYGFFHQMCTLLFP